MISPIIMAPSIYNLSTKTKALDYSLTVNTVYSCFARYKDLDNYEDGQ